VLSHTSLSLWLRPRAAFIFSPAGACPLGRAGVTAGCRGCRCCRVLVAHRVRALTGRRCHIARHNSTGCGSSARYVQWLSVVAAGRECWYVCIAAGSMSVPTPVSNVTGLRFQRLILNSCYGLHSKYGQLPNSVVRTAVQMVPDSQVG
jgi:hypothetical protein